MKRLIGFVVLLMACLMLMTGCQATFEKDKLSDDDVTLLDANGKTILKYGMSREDVEKTFGTGEEDADMKWVMYADDLTSVWYRDGKVVGYVCNNAAFSTPRGVSIGDAANEVRSAYGISSLTEVKSDISEEGNISYFYCYDTRYKMSFDTEMPVKHENLKKRFSVAILINDEYKVENFSAVDALMGFYLE